MKRPSIRRTSPKSHNSEGCSKLARKRKAREDRAGNNWISFGGGGGGSRNWEVGRRGVRTGPSNNRQRRKEIRATNRNGRRQAGRTNERTNERSYDDIAAVRKQSFTFSLSLEPVAERPSSMIELVPTVSSSCRVARRETSSVRCQVSNLSCRVVANNWS